MDTAISSASRMSLSSIALDRVSNVRSEKTGNGRIIEKEGEDPREESCSPDRKDRDLAVAGT